MYYKFCASWLGVLVIKLLLEVRLKFTPTKLPVPQAIKIMLHYPSFTVIGLLFSDTLALSVMTSSSDFS